VAEGRPALKRVLAADPRSLARRIMRRLLKVEDTFLIRGRGLVVVPGPTLDEIREQDVRAPLNLVVELRHADGQIRSATMVLGHEFFSPPPKARRWSCSFPLLRKADVLVGTEVWCTEDAFVVPPSSGMK